MLHVPQGNVPLVDSDLQHAVGVHFDLERVVLQKTRNVKPGPTPTRRRS